VKNLSEQRKERKMARKLTGLEPWTHAAGSTPGESLSITARERILNEALRPERQQAALPSLFAPARRLWLAGALPLALALLFVTGLERGVAIAPVESPKVTQVRVSKLAHQVQFDVSNGGKTHKVVRSTDPRHVASRQGQEMANGSYRDRLQDGADLVFYRID
jgi:hypothetical protein